MIFKLFLCCLIVFLASNVNCLRKSNPKSSLKQSNKDFGDSPAWKTFYLDQFLDHFNHKDDRTFKQRYLINGYYRLMHVNVKIKILINQLKKKF